MMSEDTGTQRKTTARVLSRECPVHTATPDATKLPRLRRVGGVSWV